MTLHHKMLRSLGDAPEEDRTLVQRARKVLHGTVAIFYLAFHRICDITKGLIISDPYPNKVTHVRDGTLKVGAKLRVAGVVLNLRRVTRLRHPPLALDKAGFLEHIKAIIDIFLAHLFKLILSSPPIEQ
jgi:hypothetical protein